LRSMSIPPSVESIGLFCFSGCSELKEVIFAGESKLTRIKRQTFYNCSLLQSLILPPLVEYIGECCFEGCNSLRTLTFPSPCRLRELLSVPPGWSGVLDIPDSVEILRFALLGAHAISLCFGSESRLSEVNVSRDSRRRRHVSRSFVRVTSRSLKVFRSKLEFGIFNHQ
jgi:hypothetical protein